MKNKGGKSKFKRKGSTGGFGCDLTEYLESSGQDVPLVLKSCAEFIETHGVVDGIYRLSGVTSNIQKLRQEFGSDQCPDLTREVYLQDIHCVGSLCKLYFRELPNPLLTYELYKKFTDAVSCSVEGEQLARIQSVIQELPPSHYRTLEYLSNHLTNIASHSSMTNMHIRNLALVWAPNLLRSKEIEDAGCNGDAAFLEVRVQQVVIEFILNNVKQIFKKNGTPSPELCPRDECRVMKSMTLPSGSLPMKLVSLKEAQAMSLSATHPARKERRENSLPEIVPVTGTLFHTVIDLPENKRKLSTKSKKWKSIFNLGRSESKSKLSRNGSVFVRGQKEGNEKATIRPAKSMDSLCSLPADGEEEKVSRFKRSVGTGGFFIPMSKSRATGSASTYDVRKPESEYSTEEITGATGGSPSNHDRSNPKTPQAKPPPEQMKVFRVEDEAENEQISPKVRKLFYASSDGAAKSSFPASLFPLEASPRHQRKAINISEPFAVSVPLRVSAVISNNSTPCRGTSKERPLLSSLEELPLLEPNAGAKSPVLDLLSNPASKDKAPAPNSGGEAAQEGPKQPCPKDLDSQNPTGSMLDDATKYIWEGSPERTEVEGAGSGPLSESRSNELVSISELEKVLSLESNGPETVGTRQRETSGSDSEELFDNDQDDDASITLIDPLWTDLQQELKIIESEELPVPSDYASEISQVPSPSGRIEEAPGSFKPNAHSDRSSNDLPVPESNHTDIFNSLILVHVGLEDENGNEKEESKSLGQRELEKLMTPSSPGVTHSCSTDVPLPQEIPQYVEQEEPFISVRDVWQSPHPSSMDQKDKGRGFTEKEKDGNLQVAPNIDSVNREEDSKVKSTQRKSNESLENEEDIETDGIHAFELEEVWEDHQWVTSPLHSPKLKNVLENDTQMIQPKRRGTTGELYKRPEFTRSLSLDSKDTRTSQWTLRHTALGKADGVLHVRSETNNLLKPVLQNDPAQLGQKSFKRPELPVFGKKNESREVQETSEGQQIQPVLDTCCVKNKESPSSKRLLPASPVNSAEGSSKAPSGNNLETIYNPEKSVKISTGSNEDAVGKSKTRPSSLTLDPSITTGAHFPLEKAHSASTVQGQPMEPTNAGSKLSTSERSTHVTEWKDESWKLQPRLQTQAPELESTPSTHGPSGRRNSAPVSVSAVRASFMIKMCQAKAVPVIPPKVQYTQIPQPLQTVNVDCEVSPPEKKHTAAAPSDCNSTPQQAVSSSTGCNDVPQSPKPEKKAIEEKENNDPVSSDSFPFSSLNSTSDSNHVPAQEHPVLRRKRTSDGESTADTPWSSKIERSSGISKTSFRSRPGRPQSLILFSPPFPIMDHPSPADSKIMFTPLKNPCQASSQETTPENQRTPDGVILRNKLTIPKNGQRLETSTSCFYQPQRRSVILDSRSGRQIE
ncbi:rho GTPase-activating protein 31 [Spea bombifrons]|uniref:rho GTPase-activating protein 31 n=1 Tax=Spea bombifrons TaxID=233779 RepID=UPI00234A8B99|nr:rho GTPase-activating protein 31 [Spea bombifrons]